MNKNYADTLESYMIAEESRKDMDIGLGLGIIATTVLGGKIAIDYIKYRKEKKRNEEAAKKYKAEMEKFFDENYDSINRKYKEMYNDISKAVNKLNNQKIVKEIKDLIKEDFKDELDYGERLCDEVSLPLFSMKNTAIPLSSELPRSDEEEFTLDAYVDQSVRSYLESYIDTIVETIKIKYKIWMSKVDDWGVVRFDPRELADK